MLGLKAICLDLELLYAVLFELFWRWLDPNVELLLPLAKLEFDREPVPSGLLFMRFMRCSC